jgi:DNA-binding CsgD family transcriptional regulator
MEEAEPDEITVEVRLSDEILARRISEWLDGSGGFVLGAAAGKLSVMVADHVPDDVGGPLILLAKEDELNAWPPDSRLVARLSPEGGLTKLRIAIEAAAHGLCVTETSKQAAGNSAANLSARELEVLRLLAGGSSNKEIARTLGISSHTVKFHVAAILEKLHASTRTEAAIEGVRLGLLML